MKKIGNLIVAMVIALVTTLAVSTPAMADSDKDEGVHFYNDGWFSAYADLWCFDAAGNVISHQWSGSKVHGGNHWFVVPAGTARVEWMVRMDPFGNTIHHQWLDWYDFNEYCPGGKHATMYVGGTANSPNHYDMHCAYW
jgi:hypothetical protein